MNFLQWAKKNKHEFALSLADSCARSPSLMKTPQARFDIDTFHFEGLYLNFPGIFERYEQGNADLLYIPTGSRITCKSQETIFQYPGIRKDLCDPREVVIKNANSSYGEGDPIITKEGLKISVDYALFYNPQVDRMYRNRSIKHIFSFGIITIDKLLPYLKSRGSQFKVKLYNYMYDLLYSIDYPVIYDIEEQNRLYLEGTRRRNQSMYETKPT